MKATMQNVNWNGDRSLTVLCTVDAADAGQSIRFVEVNLTFGDIEVINRVASKANMVLAERAREKRKEYEHAVRTDRGTIVIAAETQVEAESKARADGYKVL